MITNIVEKLQDEKRIKVNKWTYNCNKTMFLHVFSRDTDALNSIKHEEYESQTTFAGVAGFEVLYTHKDITPADYVFATVDHMHANNSIKHKGCIEIMSKMTHIESEMVKIKEHFPYASIIDVEQGTGCWKNHYYFTIKLGYLNI